MSECPRQNLPISQQQQRSDSITITVTEANMRTSEQQNSSAVSSPSATPASRPENPRQPSNGLRLAPMPKYHPSVYKSPATSTTNTPTSSRPTSRGIYSPRPHVRQLSELQRQQQEYQRQLLATYRQTTGLMGNAPSDTPSAPHLLPHDSPGPATPLNLEDGGDYLSARSIGEGSPRALAEKLVREEQERRAGMRVDRPSPAISPRC